MRINSKPFKMTALLIKNLVRSKGLMAGLFILFLAGIASLHIGKIFLDKTESNILITQQKQKESILRNVEYHSEEMGLLLYYLKFGLVNSAPRLAGLSIGIRDVTTSVQSVTIRNLEEQKYTSELANPFYQMLGNMDFSFVLIYLFPLVIIVFCFNLISEEKENGTWTLLVSQTSRPSKVIEKKILIRFCSILILLFLLLVIGKIYLKIPIDIPFIAFILVSVLYLTFWFSLVWLVISYHKGSGQNAIFLILTWLLLTIVIPAAINAFGFYKNPAPDAFRTFLESRDGYHNKWDQPIGPTVEKFQLHYPEFRKYGHPKDKEFSWLWYYAMQQSGDDDARKASQDLQDKLKDRVRFSRYVGFLFPPINTQFSFNLLSQSDIDHHFSFIESLTKFHEEKRLYFYPKIFTGERVLDQDWNKFDLQYYNEKVKIQWWALIAPCLLFILFFLLLARNNFYRNKIILT